MTYFVVVVEVPSVFLCMCIAFIKQTISLHFEVQWHPPFPSYFLHRVSVALWPQNGCIRPFQSMLWHNSYID